MSLYLVCEDCNRRLGNVRLRERTLPNNLHIVRARLCTPCARAGGWVDVDFVRGHPRILT